MVIENPDMPRSRTFSNDEVIEFMKEHSEPFVTVGDVADEIGVRNSTMHKRMKELHENGQIQRKKVGASAVVWWLPDRCD